MGIFADIRKVNRNIRKINQRREAAVYAKSLQYAAQALNYFRRQQSNSKYWQNRTGTARDTVFADAYREGNVIGWFISHAVDYGVYLELANDGKHAALRPVLQRYAGRYIRDVKELF